MFAGCDTNTTKPSGPNKTGIDASDKQCKKLRKDLDKSIKKTLADMKAQGMPANMLPSRAELKKQFEGPLKANGCKGF
jgi:hypothetical protein